MLCYFLTHLSKRIRTAASSIKDRIIGFFRRPDTGTQNKCQAGMSIYASGIGCRMNTGQWCKLTSSHAPVFSLFTFFGYRQ